MPEYIDATDVQNRLTPIGYAWVADRDVSGSGVTTAEEEAYVTPAIEWAGGLVDSAVMDFENPQTLRANPPQWIKDRCLDLAVARALEVGGSNVPKHMHSARVMAKAMLFGGTDEDGIYYEGLRHTRNIPGWTESRPNTGRRTIPPRVRNFD